MSQDGARKKFDVEAYIAWVELMASGSDDGCSTLRG
jgi:hypothetical protein